MSAKNELGRYRKLFIRIWRYPGFAELSSDEQVLTLYLLTGPQTNRLGLFTLSIAAAAEDLKTLPQTLTKWRRRSESRPVRRSESEPV